MRVAVVVLCEGPSQWTPRRTEVTVDVVRSEISSEVGVLNFLTVHSATLNKVALVLLPLHVAAVLRPSLPSIPQCLLRQDHGQFSTQGDIVRLLSVSITLAFYLRSLSSCLLLFPCLPVTSVLSSVFSSCFSTQFLYKM